MKWGQSSFENHFVTYLILLDLALPCRAEDQNIHQSSSRFPPYAYNYIEIKIGVETKESTLPPTPST
uniref:Hypothetical secreted peptide n=1 Tax=Triatoma matogrossensis TaxID=162370 RepID=E2J7C1_9HEMI